MIGNGAHDSVEIPFEVVGATTCRACGRVGGGNCVAKVAVGAQGAAMLAEVVACFMDLDDGVGWVVGVTRKVVCKGGAEGQAGLNVFVGRGVVG